MKSPEPPQDHYGIHQRVAHKDNIDPHCERLRTLGFTTVESGFSGAQIKQIKLAFENARAESFAKLGGQEHLKSIDEHNTVRCPLAYDRRLLALAMNETILAIANEMIGPYVVLSQQNGIVNPPDKQRYNQGAWHRDLPYQHVVFSRPLALNALFCVDDFTLENGATLVLPATHKQEMFPSESFTDQECRQIAAKAGTYIVLDCMVYHCGAANRTTTQRRAINHVFTAPFLRQQIDLPDMLGDKFPKSDAERRVLGYEIRTPRSVAEFMHARVKRQEEC